MSEPALEIEVLLTEKGYELFSKIIIYQRPNLKTKGSRPAKGMLSQQELEKYRLKTGKDYTRRIICCCTKLQAEHYFLRFGSDAIIVSPDDLAKKCAKTTAEAATVYGFILDKKKEDSDD